MDHHSGKLSFLGLDQNCQESANPNLLPWPELVPHLNSPFSKPPLPGQTPNYLLNQDLHLLGLHQGNNITSPGVLLNPYNSNIDLTSGFNSPSTFSDAYNVFLPNPTSSRPDANNVTVFSGSPSQYAFTTNPAVMNGAGSPLMVQPPTVTAEGFSTLNNPTQIAHLIPNVIMLLSSDKQNVVAQGAFTMYQLAKNEPTRALIYQNSSIIPIMVQTFNKYANNGSILRSCSAFIYYTSQNNKDALFALYQAGVLNVLDKLWEIGIDAVFYYTISAFHSIFLNVAESKDYFNDLNHLCKFVKLLAHRNNKFVAIVTDCLCICCKNFDVSFVMQSTEAPSLLLDILRNRTYEKLLYNVCRLLRELSSTHQSKMIIIKRDGLHTLTKLLLHISRRVAVTALYTIRNLSDVANKEGHTEELLNILFRFIINQLNNSQERNISSTEANPKMELQLVSSSIGILANLTCNNPSNKEFLVNKGILPVLVNVCNIVNAKEIIESTVSTLRHLTCRHSKSNEAAELLVKSRGLNVIVNLLSKCSQMAPRNCSSLKKSLFGLLTNLATKSDNLATLRELKVTQMAAHSLAAAMEELKNHPPNSPLPSGVKILSWTLHLHSCEKLLEICTILLHLMASDELSLQLMTSSSILISLFSRLLVTGNGIVSVYAASFLNDIASSVLGLQAIETAFISIHQAEVACSNSYTGNICVNRLLEISFKALPSSPVLQSISSLLGKLSKTSMGVHIKSNSLFKERQSSTVDLALQAYLNGDLNGDLHGILDSPTLAVPELGFHMANCSQLSPDTSRIYDRI